MEDILENQIVFSLNNDWAKYYQVISKIKKISKLIFKKNKNLVITN
ncbi:MAG: hypothetical protein ABI723_04805 [Bacteroidia bacterium]